MDAKRDWGHAKDYSKAQWLILQNKKPDDFVIATGKQHSVKEFVNIAAKCLGMKIEWKGKGINEVGFYKNKKIIKIDPKYFRPTEVDSLIGDARKAQKVLGWKPEITFQEMVEEMASKDLEKAKLERNINSFKSSQNDKK